LFNVPRHTGKAIIRRGRFYLEHGTKGKYASGGPAGGQTFEKFDKQVLASIMEYTDVKVDTVHTML